MDLQEPLSTTLDTEATPSASGGGMPSLTEPEATKPEAKPETARESIQAALRETEDKALGEAEKAEQAAKDAKAEKVADKPAADGKEAKAEPEAKEPAKVAETPAKAAPEAGEADADATDAEKAGERTEARSTRGEPPRNFLPDSREVWRNVPNVVKRDIETMARDHAAEIEHHRAASERYSQIRDFDELAKSNGRELRDSLTKLAQIEHQMKTSPLTALNSILMEVGPRKADGQPVSIREVAQFVMSQTDEGYQRLMQQGQPQQQQPQVDPEVARLKQHVADLETRMVTASIIQPFADKHPRYQEPQIQTDIAMFLKSDRISQSMSPSDRLAAAYEMAVRINPASSSVTIDHSADAMPERRADNDFGGSKSIKSSPGSVTETVEDQAKGGETARESILAELRRLNRA